MRHSSKVMVWSVVLVTIAMILFSSLFSDTAANWSLWIVLASVVLVGIPHGAIDHIMAEKIYGLDASWRGRALFYGMYFGLMILVGGLWLIQPVLGLLFFFAISIYHFGQADMEDFLTHESSGFTWYITRGLFIIGLIVFSDTTVSYPIMAKAVNTDAAAISHLLPDAGVMLSFVTVIYGSVFFYAWLTNRLQNGMRFLADSLLLTALFLFTGPMIGFAVYFALWHSAGHVFEMQRYLGEQNEPMSLLQFYKSAAPFTLISLAGLALLAAVNHAFGMEEQFIALMFILISVLTLPHMVIVDKMYGEAGS